MQLTVKVLGDKGESLEIEVESDSVSVDEVKKILENKTNIPVEKQKLKYRRRILSGSETLNDYGICDGGRLEVVERMQFTVKKLGSKEELLVVDDDSVTISEVKKMLEGRMEMPVEKQRLVYKGRTLSDSETLGDYSISEGARVYLAEKREYSAQAGIGTSQQSQEVPSRLKLQTPFMRRLKVFLKKHYSSEDVDKILACFKQEMESVLYSCNLDSVEWMARESMRLQKEQEAAATAQAAEAEESMQTD